MPTKIEYVDESINPIRTKDGGWHCVKTSTGCLHCYAEKINLRFGDKYYYTEKANINTRGLINSGYVLNKRAIEKPLKWKKSKRIFVQDMSDLFLEDIPVEFLCKVFDIIEGCPQHFFYILTKRPENMRWMLSTEGPVPMDIPLHFGNNDKPLKNVYLGITAENQEMFDKRWEYLKRIPCSVKWISYEPALGPLVLPEDFLALGKNGWVICGGESGPGARPMDPGWVRSLRDQCVDAEIPYFFKQWGEWKKLNGVKMWTPETDPKGTDAFSRIGKKATGRELDGKIWDQLPEVNHG